MRDRAREVMKYLVEEADLPVSDRALGWVAGDAGSLATCREARRGPSSLQILARRTVRGLPRVWPRRHPRRLLLPGLHGLKNIY